MKKKCLTGIYLLLLMLLMTACGKNEDASQTALQPYEVVSPETLQGKENAMPETLQGKENAMPETLQKNENATSGTLQGKEDASPEILQENENATSGTLQEKEDASPETLQGNEYEASEILQEYESALSEQASDISDSLPIYGEYYYDLENVVLYLDVYDELPPNYITKREAQALGWEGGSVEKYQEGAAIGGDYFGNREGLLPIADNRRYTECDIDTNGYSSRGSRRLVFSNDGLYFYTSDHYETFSEVTVTEDYEVIW